MKLKIVCDDEKYLPTYANDTDACMDLKVKIDEDNENNDERVAFVMPKETKVFGTGVKVSIPLEHVMLIFPRSSTGIKLHCMLSNTTGVIDSGYRDEIGIICWNTSDEKIILKAGERIAQGVLNEIPRGQFHIVEDITKVVGSNRNGGFGSSGK